MLEGRSKDAPGRIVFVTYADGAYERNLRINACFARNFLGAHETILLTRRDLIADPVYVQNRSIFDAKRGAGYWAWKPWAILQALERAAPGDVVIYQDAGFGLRYKSLLRPRKLIEFARQRGFIAGVVTPQYGVNRQWVHRRCMEIIGTDSDDFRDAAGVEAVVSFWTKTPNAINFVRAWLDYCLIEDAIRDILPRERAEQADDFIEHRYDQAILTSLAHKLSAPLLYPTAAALPFAKSITVLEIDQRARDNAIYSVLLRIMAGIAGVRRRLR
jgi:hypothetical protein